MRERERQMPRMKAIEVMRIGRRRVAAACVTASIGSRALLAQLIRELDDENRVLGREADQHDVADLRVDVATT